MLALWSAFEATRESCSTVHVMERIAQMAKDVGVRGTAVYGILTRMDDSLSLSATSAGHDPFLIVRSTDGQYPGFDIPGNDSVAKGLMFGVKANRFGADRFNLRPGDVVVAYTDGVSDRISRQQIHDLARAAIEDTQSASQLANIILNRATEAARRAQDGKVDDATVVVVKIK